MANRRVSTGIVDRGNGSYQFTVSCGYDGTGRQIRKTRTFHAPQGISQRKGDKLAVIEYAKFRDSIAGNIEMDENMRFSQLADFYFSIMGNELKESTLRKYRQIYASKYEKPFGNLKLKAFNRAMLSRFFCGLNVSPVTVQHYRIALSSIFHFAERQGIIDRNPCHGVILPKNNDTDSAKRKCLEIGEIEPFLDSFNKDSQTFIITEILLCTGLRAGELCGLSWNDIEFDHINRCGKLHVNYNLIDVGKELKLVTPKTAKSKRCILFGETLYSVLQEQKARYERDKPTFSTCTNGVIYGRGGKRVRPANVTQYMKFALRNTEYSWVTPHCLRHTNASVLFDAGKEMKVVSEHLGHSNIAITANIYTHILNNQRRETAEILDVTFKSMVKKNSAV